MFRIENVVSSDLNAVFQFMLECDIEEFGTADSSREDLEELWGEIDLSRDAWIVYDERNRIIGHASISEYGGRYTQEIYLSGKHAPQGVEDELTRLCLARVEQMRAANQVEQVLVNAFVSGVNQRLQQLYERNGFTPFTYHYRMQIDFDVLYQPPEWPDQFTLDSFAEKDESEVFALIEETFTWEGHAPSTLENWRKWILRGGRYDPQYFVLVRDGSRLAGIALSYAEETGGWIRQLAVAKDYQGKGLGGRLLRHMFWVFSNQGLKSVGLGVASANKTATRFYERNGMRKTREFIEYHKIVGKI